MIVGAQVLKDCLLLGINSRCVWPFLQGGKEVFIMSVL